METERQHIEAAEFGHEQRDPQRDRKLTIRAEHVMAQWMLNNRDSALYEDVESGATSKERAYRILKETGGQDPKTKLMRTDLLNYSAEFEMWNSRESQRPAVVAMFDIDHFRNINDELTHIGADEVLKRVADIIAEEVRASDDELRVVRHGGEEFAVLLGESTLEEARVPVERVRQRIEEELRDVRPNGEPVTVSCGLSEYQPQEGELEPETWFKRADEQLMAAKKAGRNRILPEAA